MWETIGNLGNGALKWLGTGDNGINLLKGVGTAATGLGQYNAAQQQNKYAKQMLDLQTQNYNYELDKEKKRQKSWDDAVANIYGTPYIPLGTTTTSSARIPLSGV